MTAEIDAILTNLKTVADQLAAKDAQIARLNALLNAGGLQSPPLPSARFRPPGKFGAWTNAVVAVSYESARRHNVPRWFLYAIIQRESSGDPRSFNPNGGYGLTQLTSKAYTGHPYPMDQATPINGNPRWEADMGFPEYGPWIDMMAVSVLNGVAPDYGAFDPRQNIERFLTGFAVPCWIMLKAHLGLDDAETWRAVAWSWNHGIALPPGHIRYTKGLDDPSYLTLWDTYVAEFRPKVEAEDGVWAGPPVL